MPIAKKINGRYVYIDTNSEEKDKPIKSKIEKPIKRYSTREVLEWAEIKYWQFQIIIEENGFEPIFEGNTGQFWDRETVDKIIEAADIRNGNYEL